MKFTYILACFNSICFFLHSIDVIHIGTVPVWLGGTAAFCWLVELFRCFYIKKVIYTYDED